MPHAGPRVSICIPHWQVPDYATICLRSIRKHSRRYNVEVIVVDNGSRDGSLEYLRSLDWIRLIERPDETRDNWPKNFFTALDCGVHAATGEFFMSMHTDVFVKRDDWLEPFLREISRSERVAASGAWKLTLESPLYAWQKRIVGYATYRLKRALGGRRRHIFWQQGHYPRDYCAMYRRRVLLDRRITFDAVNGWIGGGHSVAMQIFAAGYEMGMFPVAEMAQRVAHVTHGTAAVTPWRPLNHARAQRKAERSVSRLFQEPWVRNLRDDHSLDRAA
ncbi:MAG TPA: glycosyltransferase family 2 protein [Planctomycetaceae bacterium]|nr:glycosyltransferase family 2 protein [Planctomycetaceae bacterium]